MGGTAALAGASVAKETCEMMLRLGSLVHQLQKVRVCRSRDRDTEAERKRSILAGVPGREGVVMAEVGWGSGMDMVCTWGCAACSCIAVCACQVSRGSWRQGDSWRADASTAGGATSEAQAATGPHTPAPTD